MMTSRRPHLLNAALWFLTLAVALLMPLAAEAQIRSGQAPSTGNASQAAENACRTHVNSLRTSIEGLRNDLAAIRACSDQGQIAMRQPAPNGPIVCMPMVQGHHQWHQSSGNNTEIEFFKEGGWGDRRSLVGKQGDAGQDAHCYLCTGLWQNPSCPANFTGNHTAPQTCSAANTCCGGPETITVECCNGRPCAELADWVVEHTWCETLGRNVVSRVTCPAEECRYDPPPVEACPEACTPGYYTFEYTGWSACAHGQHTRTCQRCDGQPADCSQCGGQCDGICTEPCTSYTWQPSADWGACSGGGSDSCGGGQQTRPGTCRCDQTGEAVSASLCPTEQRQRACSYTYNYTDWGSCSGGNKTRTCRRCDGQTADCSLCGGACSSNEGCVSNVTYQWSRVSHVYGPGFGCHLGADVQSAQHDVKRGLLVQHGRCTGPYDCDFTVNTSNNPCNASTAGQDIHVYRSCGGWQSGLEGYSGYICEASDGSHCGTMANNYRDGVDPDMWDDDMCWYR